MKLSFDKEKKVQSRFKKKYFLFFSSLITYKSLHKFKNNKVIKCVRVWGGGGGGSILQRSKLAWGGPVSKLATVSTFQNHLLIFGEIPVMTESYFASTRSQYDLEVLG